MRLIALTLVAVTACSVPIARAQQIFDVWQTTWDRQKLLAYTSLASPINFGTKGAIGDADIVVSDSNVYQSVVGFGSTLTDSAALVLSQLKTKNSDNYWKLLNYMFDPTDGANSAGLTILRVSLGASDFSANVYSFDDSSGDTDLSEFNINKAPSYLYSTIKDIQGINKILKVFVVPWSPPGWMKSGGNGMNGGSLQSQYNTLYANYLFKSVQGFAGKGITPWAISIQNEPQHSTSSYPSASMSVSQMGQIGTTLRTLLNNNGFGSIRIIGYEHNWDNAATYPVQLMQSYGSAFSGVAFHCYAGTVDQQDSFHSKYPSKEIYFTECTGTVGTDWWSDMKWYTDTLWIGAIAKNSQSGLMWNLAGRSDGGPVLPGTGSCATPNGCRPVVTVNTDGTYTVNQEFFSMAQASKAILPKDSNGPWGKRIGVSVGGWAGGYIQVGAYVTGRAKSSDWSRYALVVLNWRDTDDNGNWNPQSVRTTIEFRGVQATYTFPVGVTTLWWYAPATSFNGTSNIRVDGKQVFFSQDK